MSSNLKSLEIIERNSRVSELAVKNQLLRNLLSQPGARDYLLPQLNVVSLSTNQVLYEQGDKIDFVYFPIDAIISGLAIMEDGTIVETSMIGPEGMVGISAILGTGRSRQWFWDLISGNAIQLEARALDKLFVQNESALKSLLGCYRSLVTQVSQRCVCNTRHTIMERLCCWLLMVHDRVGGNNLKLTQEMIASRVGARRAGITVAAGMLQDMQGIEYRRGQLHIKNRGVLESAACECYGAISAEFHLREDV
jgi:CRP-like cAMP-binding protein